MNALVERRMPAALAVLAIGVALAGCGDDGGGGVNSEERADELAACAEDAGFEPTVSDGEEPGATAVDLTTETATIVLQVFESPEDAAAYESAAGLDQEQVGEVVILGGAIPPEERAEILDCINA